MCLRAEEGERIADKTVLKMMREMGLRCGIRRERAYHRYNSYKGPVGQSFENIIGRDFTATGPWQKMGTDVTEFKLSFGKAYLAPVYDFASKEIVAHSISMCPNLAQQQEMLQILMEAKPAGVEPILHSDMGWQYQHETYISTLADNGFIQRCHAKATASTTAPLSRSSDTSRTSSFAAKTGRPSRASKPTSTPTSRTGIQHDAK